jgi:arsenite oxidase small subunit
MKRRNFMQACAASAAGAALTDAQGAAPTDARVAGQVTVRHFARTRLVDERGSPITLAHLEPGVNYVFDYPYAATPCFLLRLDHPAPGGITLKTESGAAYTWEGGVGPGKAVVAYSAICAHKMTYPTRQVSFIGYRDAPSPVAGKGKVITCCSDRSVYDPALGARVVSGPAPQPLATILLEHDPANDGLLALGSFGGDLFDAFFRKYEFRLQLEMGARAHAAVEATTVLRPLERYSTQWAQC